eukprot:CAMPEP_0115734292 /NCGR_PEP_ID=MMETSP0272-20121206/86112_1 /TAXON_ID=71861 /ORGANISM="Scrippsiella trochoidea, Strain CCMP3099" /LENGTH=44 /DNA_ID= /DNA_START= /DNA_END= /DNA_ORIENTATION=
MAAATAAGGGTCGGGADIPAGITRQTPLQPPPTGRVQLEPPTAT